MLRRRSLTAKKFPLEDEYYHTTFPKVVKDTSLFRSTDARQLSALARGKTSQLATLKTLCIYWTTQETDFPGKMKVESGGSEWARYQGKPGF